MFKGITGHLYSDRDTIEFKQLSTAELSSSAKLIYQLAHEDGLSSWVYMGLNTELAAVNKDNPNADELTALAERFLTSEDWEELDDIFDTVVKVAGDAAASDLCGIRLDWLKERHKYQAYTAALDIKARIDELIACEDICDASFVDTQILTELRSMVYKPCSGNFINSGEYADKYCFLYGVLSADKMSIPK
ncbi:MAG TPA: hypothetical protein DIT84_01900 [Clostridiales bacterium]|nr:hypothetical protein [Clostridiales bacterium]